MKAGADFNPDSMAAYHTDPGWCDFWDAPLFIPRVPSCRYCGTTDLRWKKLDSGWRLHHKNGTLHTCEEYARCQRLA